MLYAASTGTLKLLLELELKAERQLKGKGCAVLAVRSAQPHAA
jgi:hypothetical protein